MAKYEKHVEQNRARVIVAGPSGSGKTSLIATLANGGYRTCVIDADNGLDILGDLLTPEGQENLHYITLADNHEKKTSAFGQFRDLITNGWKDEHEDLGRMQKWGNETVLVLDTMNFLGKASMRVSLAQAGKPIDSTPELQQWGDAGRRLEKRIENLCSKEFKCHLVVMTHLKQVEDSIGRVKFWPASVGSAVSQDIGAYFNTVLRIDTQVTATRGVVRSLRTASDNKMDLKTSRPSVFTEPDMGFDLLPFLKVYEA